MANEINPIFIILFNFINLFAFISNLLTFSFDTVKSFILFTNVNLAGIIFSYLISRFIYYYILNCRTKKKYKREENNNDKKYIVQRCYGDGFGYDKDGKPIESRIEKKKDKNGKEIDTGIDKNDEDNCRDYYYLVEKKGNRFYRIVDTYTLSQLGYPRPSRRAEKCFRLNNKKIIGKEIKIYNMVDIGNIIGLNKDIKN